MSDFPGGPDVSRDQAEDAVCTLLLGFWSVADLRHFQQLHAQLTGGRPAFLGRVLGWATRRAEASA